MKSLLWRLGVPAVGLAVAIAAGWRLSSSATVLIVICAWLPLALFCLLAPRNRAALPVALVLLAAIGSIWWVLPGRPGDRSVAGSTLIWYPLLGGLALLAVVWRVHLRRGSVRPLWSRLRGTGSGGPSWQRWTATAVAAGMLAVGGCGGGLLHDQVSVPSPDELFPLPAGLEATTAEGPDGENGCDRTGHACWTYYQITGDNGESTTVLTERLQRHLRESKGWSDAECQPIRRTRVDLCITVTSDPASTDEHPAIGVELWTTKLGHTP
ncbi:hypothetical protein [Dactylosporangium sp. CS-033363]|uniref:hypothetical protein n=1 Tax=Dactylosporangium sp. CS-033363 TaxID=3239935 RepID=UPI003D8CEAF0